MRTFDIVPKGTTHCYLNAKGFGFYSLINDTWRFWSPCHGCWELVIDNSPMFDYFPLQQITLGAGGDKMTKWKSKDVAYDPNGNVRNCVVVVGEK